MQIAPDDYNLLGQLMRQMLADSRQPEETNTEFLEHYKAVRANKYPTITDIDMSVRWVLFTAATRLPTQYNTQRFTGNRSSGFGFLAKLRTYMNDEDIDAALVRIMAEIFADDFIPIPEARHVYVGAPDGERRCLLSRPSEAHVLGITDKWDRSAEAVAALYPAEWMSYGELPEVLARQVDKLGLAHNAKCRYLVWLQEERYRFAPSVHCTGADGFWDATYVSLSGERFGILDTRDVWMVAVVEEPREMTHKKTMH